MTKPTKATHQGSSDFTRAILDDSAISLDRATGGKSGEPTSEKGISVIDRPIEKSLSQTFADLGFGQELVKDVTSIFESKIDFRKLRKGDRITIAFDEEIVGDRSSDMGTVRAVRLNHRGKDFYAFSFGDNASGGYYDEKGRSLETTFLPSPVSIGRVTSGFSKARLHPVLGNYAPHFGIDYAAPVGTPIVSIADGLVQEARTHEAKGKFVRIKHAEGYETEYLHMSRFQKGIGRGLPVRRGQIIGYVGTTGIATGPHVELRFKKNGRFVDLAREEFSSLSLLPDSLQDCFQKRAETLKELLEDEGRQDKSDFLFLCSAGREAGTM